MSDAVKKVPLRIRLPFESQQEFVERYGANVTRGGIFIATRQPKPIGTEISFELVLKDGTRLMRGEGVVQEVEETDETGRSGMLLRFVRLEPKTKALIDEILLAQEQVAAEAPVAEASEPLPPPAPRASVPVSAPEVDSRPRALADDVVLGIDLGTTTCRAALFLDGEPKLVPVSREKQFALPSVVAIDQNGQLVVGNAAKTILIASPERAAAGFKRIMGRRARSKQMQQLQPKLPFAAVADMEGDCGIELAGKTWSVPELAAQLLTELKVAAQELIGRPVTRAVLCVPAWYTDHQRSAALDAGRLAGLDVLRVVNEPTAVALAFGYGKGLARKRLLVYDLGGGTFDASVVEMTGDDLEVVSTGGDNFLGGVDFDAALTTSLVDALTEAARDTVLASRVSVQRVKDAAEVAKIALSDAEQAVVDLPMLAVNEGGKPVDLHADVTRVRLEQLTAPLVERTIEITKVVMEAARVQPGSLDEVLLVGGQSRAPLVRQKLEQLLGRPARTDVDPQGAVALGAALVGQSLVLRERGKSGVTLSEVLSAPIGVAVQGGGFRRVLERNTRLPAEKTLEIPVSAGVAVKLAVFQGTSPRADDNEYLGALQVTPPRAGELSVRFSVTPDGRLSVSAEGAARADAIFSTTDASDETRAALLAAAPLPGEGQPQATRGLMSGLKKLFNRS